MYRRGNYSIGRVWIDNIAFYNVTAGVYADLQGPLDRRVARIGVFGNAFDSYSPEDVGLDMERVQSKAYNIGQLVAEQGLILVNGACPGIPNIAAAGAHSKGGIVAGFSPERSESVHINNYRWRKDEIPHLLIAYLGTKPDQMPPDAGRLFVTRDVPNVFSIDAAIIIGGSYGTNHEVAIAAELGLLVMLLNGTGGVADSAEAYYDAIKKPNNLACFIGEGDENILIERMLEELYQRGILTRETNPRHPLDTVLEKVEKKVA